MDFDLTQMSWLGSCASVPRALVVGSQTPFNTLEDMVKSEKTVRFSSSGVGTTSHTDIIIIGSILGAKSWKPVVGYQGSESELALIRGEVDAEFVTWSSAMPFVERGEFRVLYFTSQEPIPGYEKLPILQNIIYEKNQDIAEILLLQAEVSYPFAGPPAIPTDRLQVIREAFKKSWYDSELLRTAKMSGLSVHYIGPEEVQKKLKTVLRQKPETVELIKSAYRK